MGHQLCRDAAHRLTRAGVGDPIIEHSIVGAIALDIRDRFVHLYQGPFHRYVRRKASLAINAAWHPGSVCKMHSAR